MAGDNIRNVEGQLDRSARSPRDDERPAPEPKFGVGKKQAGSADPLIKKLSGDSLITDFTDMKQCFLTDSSEFIGERSLEVNKKGFRHSIALRDRDISTLVSSINKPAANISNALNITPAQYAYFVPKIELYKVLYSGQRTFVGEAPIPFSTDSRSTISSILASGASRGDDVGLVDFSVNFENGNPFAAGRMVNGSIKILFQNGESLTKDRIIPISSQGGGTTPFKFSDLISRSGQSPRAFDGNHYRIRADFGYQAPAIPPEDLSPKLAEQFEAMNLSLILELIDYDLSFEQNGAVTLEISYRSYVEAILDRSTYDIFTTTPNPKFDKYKEGLEQKAKELKGKMLAAEAKLDVTRKSNLEFMSDAEIQSVKDSYGLVPGAINEGLVGGYAWVTEWLSDDTEEAEKAIAANTGELTTAVGANKITMYSRILTYLYDNDKVRKITIPKGDLLYYSDEYKDAVKQSVSEGSLGALGVNVGTTLDSLVSAGLAGEGQQAIADQTVAKSRQKALERSQAAIKGSMTTFAKGTGKSFGNEVAARAKEIASKEDKGAINEEIVRKATGDTFTDIEFQISKATKPTAADGNMELYWFYFGDLLTAVVDTAKIADKMGSDHVGFMFGNALLPGKENKNSEISLLDMPISLEAFLKFFKKTYIDKDITRYSLAKFIQDASLQLLLPSMNNMCFGESVRRPVKIKTSTLEVGTYTHEGQATNPFPTSSGGSQKRIVSTTSLAKLASNAVLRKRNANQRYFYTLVYVAQSGLPSGLNGDTVKDHEKGIYHFYIGVDRGLVKEVSFSKAKKNFQAEAMAQKAVASGDEFAEIFNLFNVNIEMLGNTLLKPGCHIFINPTLTGVGAKTSSTLGLGGYYLVLEVSNQLSKDGWSTSIKADSVSRISNATAYFTSVFNPASAEQISSAAEKVEAP